MRVSNNKILHYFAAFLMVILLPLTACDDDDGAEPANGEGVEETYDVTLEVTGTVNVADGIVWVMGDDQGTGTESALPWEKEHTCGEDEKLELVAASEEVGEITVTIYVDGDVMATSTGNWDPDHEETAALVSTRTPDPD